MGHRGKLAAGVVTLAVVASLVIPLVVVFLGVLVVALVALDTVVPGVVPGLRTLFRVPVAPRSRRRARLMIAGGIGVLLVACGSAGARISGQFRTEWRLRERQHSTAEQQVTACLTEARQHLAGNEPELAELSLMDAGAVAGIDPERRAEVDELLARIRRSGDAKAIREVLVHLPPDAFEAFARGDSVPDALEFPERALTFRAVELARAQLDEVRAARAPR